jgi:hypothetical protein
MGFNSGLKGLTTGALYYQQCHISIIIALLAT